MQFTIFLASLFAALTVASPIDRNASPAVSKRNLHVYASCVDRGLDGINETAEDVNTPSFLVPRFPCK